MKKKNSKYLFTKDFEYQIVYKLNCPVKSQFIPGGAFAPSSESLTSTL